MTSVIIPTIALSYYRVEYNLRQSQSRTRYVIDIILIMKSTRCYSTNALTVPVALTGQSFVNTRKRGIHVSIYYTYFQCHVRIWFITKEWHDITHSYL